MSIHLSAQKEASTLLDKELLEAVSQNRMTEVKQKLTDEIDVNITDAYGRSLLMFAVINNNKELARLLIKKGADPNYHINQKAKQNSNKNAVAMLLLKGRSVLDYGIASKDTSMVDFLIDAGAKLNIKNKEISSTVAKASLDGNIKMVRYLLSKGAKVSDETGAYLIVNHINKGADVLHKITPVNKNTDFSLIKIWDDYGIPTDDEKLLRLTSFLGHTSKETKNVKNYMAAYREWLNKEQEIISELPAVMEVKNESERDKLIEESLKKQEENREGIRLVQDEAQREHNRTWKFIFIALGIGLAFFLLSHYLTVYLNFRSRKQSKPPAPPYIRPNITKASLPLRKAGVIDRKSKKKREKRTSIGKLPITAKGWIKDDTTKIEVLYLTIEDMINPIGLKNEHERAVREMIWYIRRLENLSNEKVDNRVNEQGLDRKLDFLWRSIDPCNVRDVYKRSLFILVENYSKKDKRVMAVLNKMKRRSWS
ncbi:ankyrin repeat domain-containing protein [Dysgonomonas alginatilytica]|uniref:ankyrin repeat domain-containing protein n=1 Tax=Dysgonomonas alginatilytica TaxID=1605892 RepID=UPI00147592DF|nr:ankyrin repeat domain-containing protein [Dysgonomonas alginatilytica]